MTDVEVPFAARLPSVRSRDLARYLAVLALFLAGTTGFSPTMSTLREFGLRPANVVLAVALVPMLLACRKGAMIELPRLFVIAISVFLLVAAANLIVLLVKIEPLYGVHSPLVAWILQFGMYAWLPVSILAWCYLLTQLAGPDQERQFTFVLAAAAAILMFFFANKLLSFLNDLGVVPVPGLLSKDVWTILTSSTDHRPAGLNTEPSHYATWVIWMWPFLLFANRSIFSTRELWLYRVLGCLLIVTGIASGARTLLMVFAIQAGITVVVVLLFRMGRLRMRFAGGALIALAGIAVVITGWDNAVSIFDVQSSASSAARWGSFVGTWRMFNQAPLFGLGIGGHASYYAYFYPTFGLVSEEFYYHTQNINYEFRPSASSMYLRAAAELGIFGLLSLLAMTLLPFAAFVRTAIRRGRSALHPLALPLAVSGVGTLVVWLSSDETGYPGVPIIAALSLVLLAARRTSLGLDSTSLTSPKSDANAP